MNHSYVTSILTFIHMYPTVIIHSLDLLGPSSSLVGDTHQQLPLLRCSHSVVILVGSDRPESADYSKDPGYSCLDHDEKEVCSVISIRIHVD